MTRNAIPGGSLCLVLLSVALAGCGTSDGDPTVTDTTVPQGATADRAEFLAEGDAICTEGQAEAAELARRAQEIQRRSGTVPDEEVFGEAAEVWNDQIALIERFRDRLDDLEPPPGDEARVEEFIVALDDGLEIARGIKSSLDDREEPSSERLQSYATTVARGNTLARAYGFTVCGQTG